MTNVIDGTTKESQGLKPAWWRRDNVRAKARTYLRSKGRCSQGQRPMRALSCFFSYGSGAGREGECSWRAQKQIPKGNDRKKGKNNRKGEYRGLSTALRFGRDDECSGRAQKQIPKGNDRKKGKNNRNYKGEYLPV